MSDIGFKLIKVNVTRKHIHDGVCKNPRSCAIALALQEHIKPEYEISNSGTMWRIYSIHNDIMAKSLKAQGWMPPNVTKFTRRYDEDNGIGYPFEFEVELPMEYLK